MDDFCLFFHLCDELIYEIFLYHLDVYSILSCKLVCRHFFDLLSDSVFWKQRTSLLLPTSSIVSCSHLFISSLSPLASLLCKLEYTRQWVVKYLHDQLSLASVQSANVDPNTYNPTVIRDVFSAIGQFNIGSHLRVLRQDGTYDHAIISEADCHDNTCNVIFFSACGKYELGISQTEATPSHDSKIGSYMRSSVYEWIGEDKANVSLVICQPALSHEQIIMLANMTLDNAERPTATGGHAYYWSSALFAYWCQTGHLCLALDVGEKVKEKGHRESMKLAEAKRKKRKAPAGTTFNTLPKKQATIDDNHKSKGKD